MKAYRGLEVLLHSFLTSALGGNDCLGVLVKRNLLPLISNSLLL